MLLEIDGESLVDLDFRFKNSVLEGLCMEVPKVFREFPENKSNRSLRVCRPEGVTEGTPVMAASSNAGVEIGISPDWLSFN